jgi:hypothetical protein
LPKHRRCCFSLNLPLPCRENPDKTCDKRGDIQPFDLKGISVTLVATPKPVRLNAKKNAWRQDSGTNFSLFHQVKVETLLPPASAHFLSVGGAGREAFGKENLRAALYLSARRLLSVRRRFAFSAALDTDN